MKNLIDENVRLTLHCKIHEYAQVSKFIGLTFNTQVHGKI